MPGMPRRRLTSLASALAVAVVGVGVVAGSAGGAKVQPQKGKYSGATKQSNVLKSARGIAFKVKGKKITLTTEPTVARGFCVAPPVFLIDGKAVEAKIKGGRFTFSRTFSGSKINKIKGTFIDEKSIEGELTYFFDASDAGLCSAGKKVTKFAAKK
jgi:hypothetical protein